MPKSTRQPKAKRAKLVGVESAPPPRKAARSRTLRNGRNGVETHRRARAKVRPGPGTGQLEHEEKLPLTIRLRNGAEVDARSASAEWTTLDRMRRKGSFRFKALVALTFGEGEQVSKKSIKELRGWVDQSGAVRPMVRHVLESCYQKTEQGRVWKKLVDDDDKQGQLALQVIEAGQPARDMELVRRALQAEQERGP
jgi:hypothetical protein